MSLEKRRQREREEYERCKKERICYDCKIPLPISCKTFRCPSCLRDIRDRKLKKKRAYVPPTEQQAKSAYDSFSLESPKAKRKYKLETLRKRAKLYRQRKREQGLCIVSGCNNKAETLRCEACKDVQRKYHRRYRKTSEKFKAARRIAAKEYYHRRKKCHQLEQPSANPNQSQVDNPEGKSPRD